MPKLTREEISRLGGNALYTKRGTNWMKYIGSLGGNALYDKRGHDWMVEIGCRGAGEFQRLYKVLPYGTSQYQIVRRENDEIVAIF